MSNRIGVTVVGILCLLAVLGLGPVVFRLPLMIELPNEGWNAVHAMHAFGAALYPNPNNGIINNYPPLWHYLTGALLIVTGDPIFAGRIVTIAAYVATIGAVSVLARALNATWIASALAAAWLAAELALHFSTQVGLSEPQMLASAFIVGATALVIRSHSRCYVVTAALLMTLGLGLKHIDIALPLATAAWLAIYRPSIFRVWILAVLFAGSMALVALKAGYGTNVIANLTVQRALSMNRLITNLALSTKAIVPIAATGWLLCRVRWPLEPPIVFAAFAVAAGILEILVFGAAIGVSKNIAWDLMIGAAISSAIIWDRITTQFAPAWRMRIHILLVLVILARLIAGLSTETVTFWFDRNSRAQLKDQAAQLVELRDRLRAVSDPVACEHLSVCAWAGHASQIDLWKLRFERTLHPIIDPNEVVAGISRGQFAAVTLFGRYSGPENDGNLPGLSAALVACCDHPIYFGSSTLYIRRAHGR